VADANGANAARSGAQALERAIAVLRCFEGDAELGVAQVARQLALSGSTAHRLLRTLCRGGLVAQDTTSGRYRLGPRMATLGAAASERLGYDSARPQLERLVAETGESFTLGVLDSRQSLTVLGVTARTRNAVPVLTGVYAPVHACAMGKTLVAFGAGWAETAAAVGASLPADLPRITDHTITDPRVLDKELRVTRERGWAANDEEVIPRVRGVSVPVYAADGQVAAALGVAVRADRLDPAEFAQWAELVRRGAERMRGLVVPAQLPTG